MSIKLFGVDSEKLYEFEGPESSYQTIEYYNILLLGSSFFSDKIRINSGVMNNFVIGHEQYGNNNSEIRKVKMVDPIKSIVATFVEATNSSIYSLKDVYYLESEEEITFGY